MNPIPKWWVEGISDFKELKCPFVISPSGEFSISMLLTPIE
jgi:hypothetical protein